MADTPRLDHLAIAARTLEEGAAWIRSHLGTEPDPGGSHPEIGTHNRLLRLGEGEYLEVIAVDPAAPHPGFPRWFGLDVFDGPPRLVGWVARTRGDLTQPGATPRDLSRGDLHWRFSLPDDGLPLDGGVTPALIDWRGGPHPSARLPDRGMRLTALELRHPAPLPDLPVTDSRIALRQGPVSLHARIRTPDQEVVL